MASPAAQSPLDPAAIAAALGGMAACFDLGVLESCASTNAELMARAKSGAPAGTVVAAERQTAGRGRRGRPWISAPGDSLAFSLLWRFPSGAAMDGLSLAAGVAVAETLAGLGATGIALKWPNDVLRAGRKLAGMLIELVPGASPAAVIGIGLNLRLPDDMPGDIRDAAAALDLPISRSELLGRLLAGLHGAMASFAAEGFSAARPRWQALNAHAGAAVRLLSDAAPPLEGRCTGIDEDGALLLETIDGIRRVVSGDVSLRAA